METKTIRTNIKPRYAHIASTLAARDNCARSGNRDWRAIWGRVLELLCAELPSGSGFDSGSQLESDSTPEKLIFHTSYHHMTEGSYTGWSEHRITLRPSFVHGYTMTISGKNPNDIKGYIGDCFNGFLSDPIDLDPLILQARKDELAHFDFVQATTKKDSES